MRKLGFYTSEGNSPILQSQFKRETQVSGQMGTPDICCDLTTAG